MKTTIELPDELLIRAKQTAAQQRRPLRALVEEALRNLLAGVRPGKSAGRKKAMIDWNRITVDAGPPPDLDLSSREAMYEWLDRNS